MPQDSARLLAFARTLQAAEGFRALVSATANEIRETLGYQTAWFAILEPDASEVRIIGVDGPVEVDVWEHATLLPLAGDPYMERIAAAVEPQIVEDAQVDPNVNRAIVEALGNRTIVNVPMRLVDAPFGWLGTGTFGDEGVKLPSDDDLAYLVAIASQVVAATARTVMMKQREQALAERLKYERLLADRQRIESLGTLAGGVAHDFNNLLTVIMASASLLRHGEQNSDRADELMIIVEAAERAAELTGRLLTLGRRRPLALRATRMDDVIASVVQMMRRVIPSDISIAVVPGEALPTVLADGSQLEQVLMNLCVNARDAMPQGGRLTIESEHVVLNDGFQEQNPWAKPGRYVLLSVTDTGEGMSRETLGRVFEPFFTTKTEGRGSGLGLAVCMGIIEQHGGMLHAYSELAVGTTFKVYVPVTDRTAIDVNTKPARPATGTERVLVADDEPHVRRVIERVLTRHGYQVQSVEDGAAAVAACRAAEFDLVILDAVMPVLGGRQAFEAIRAERPGLPILFASGYGAEELTTRFLADLEVPLLPKPFDPDTLLRTVRELLDER